MIYIVGPLGTAVLEETSSFSLHITSSDDELYENPELHQISLTGGEFVPWTIFYKGALPTCQKMMHFILKQHMSDVGLIDITDLAEVADGVVVQLVD